MPLPRKGIHLKVPSVPALARYFASIRLTLHSSTQFGPDGTPHPVWQLTQDDSSKPYWLGDTKLFASPAELWSAWKTHQLVLHLEHEQALRLVRFYLRHEEEHFESFNAWLDYRASARPAAFEEVDTGAWPWTAATASLDRRNRLHTYGWPWSDAPTVPVIRRCTKRAEGQGWARRAVMVADFDRQSAVRYTAAIRDLVQRERRRMFDGKMRKAGLNPTRTTRRL